MNYSFKYKKMIKKMKKIIILIRNRLKKFENLLIINNN